MEIVWQIALGFKLYWFMRFIPCILVFVLLLAMLGCENNQTRMIQKEVEILVGEPGPLAEKAERLLVNRGKAVIPILETGLYMGDGLGKIKVIRVLEQIGDPAGLPIIKYLAFHDKESQVREFANRVLLEW